MIRWRSMAALACFAVLAGCASIQSVEPADGIDASAYYVAFSVSTASVIRGDAEWRPSALVISTSGAGGEAIPLEYYTGGAMFLFEVSEPHLSFDALVIRDVRHYDRERKTFRTSAPGPSVDLVAGAVTYLGRLQLTDVNQESIPGRGFAIARDASIDISDQNAVDIVALRETYPFVSDEMLQIRPMADWGGGTVALIESQRASFERPADEFGTNPNVPRVFGGAD